ncbi:MAG: DUF2089 family protein [Candidatus Hinthialibacter antarcticus]|nr:DUF2089 family protein [Candidatus Hinthialibacter antarcticus]
MNLQNEQPSWLRALNDEDLQFLKRFILASGSLKALASEYGISYPTVRTRLDRLIEKVKVAEQSGLEDEFHRLIQIKVAEGSLGASTAKQLLKVHRESVKSMEEQS